MNKTEELPTVRGPRIFAGTRIVAGFSTRHGGVSEAPYNTLNVGLSTADDVASVAANRGILFRSMGLDPERVAIAGQVHGADVLFVDAPGLYSGVDALVTVTEGLALAITAADCAVVLLADVESGPVGAAHAGWRGTVGRIVPRMVDRMVMRGARRDRLSAYVSPCISTDRFEVGEAVAALFDTDCVQRKATWPRPHVDLRGAILRQLLNSGLRPSHIEVSDECTYDDPDYYSYRAESGRTGRMMGSIALTGARRM